MSKAPPPRRVVAREGRLGHLSPVERAALAAVGARIRELRTAATAEDGSRLSIAGLARLAGLNASALGEIERGRGNLTVAAAARLARALGVPLVHLFDAEAGARDADG